MDGQGEGGVVADLRQGMDQLNLASQGIQHATGARPRTRPQDHTYHTADDPPYQNTTQVEGRPPIPARRQLPGVQTYHLPGDPRTTVVVNIHQQQPPPPPLPAARRPMPGAEDEDANADPLNQTLSHGQVLRINARRIRRTQSTWPTGRLIFSSSAVVLTNSSSPIPNPFLPVVA